MLVEAQPRLVAWHYTAAGCRASGGLLAAGGPTGQRDSSPHLEAISHVTAGVGLLETLPEEDRAT